MSNIDIKKAIKLLLIEIIEELYIKEDNDKNKIDKNEIYKNEIYKNEIDKNEIDKNEIDKNEIDKNEIDKIKKTRICNTSDMSDISSEEDISEDTPIIFTKNEVSKRIFIRSILS
jgi:hypothetical protein